ncbi:MULTISPECIES: cytochrome c3 family protein [unclassified Duganella]|jgi:mono/diheme cytochrome c family protein|uniref:cytochrome c3 family protein n=1 Tax=unclassified Duganella TaxID=2636909 RepID=UPI00089136FF|nr:MULTISPECIES: cytochrome c3 family protein [unclassified Duganella]SDH14000.1 Cytochrome c3 [Duganella sp. OV458]SDK28573.1 Cytochrome c3 [Duganella sp. OV510]
MQARNNDKLQQEIDGLQRPLVGRRLMSWMAFVLVLLACLVLPVMASIWPSAFHPVEEKTAKLRQTPHAAPVLASGFTRASPTALGLDAQWNPGTLSASHQPFGLDCKSCHSKPFQQVQDKDCLACHKGIGNHVADKVASMPALHETRCATCHRDHQGAEGLVSQNRRYIGAGCASCHGDLESKLPGTQVANVKDFAKAHPQFRVQVAASETTFVRLRQSSVPITQANTLKFPHDIHVAAGGIAGPNGKTRLECASCHRPNAGNDGFERVSMQRDCQSCHTLAFEPALSQRQVPHGSVPEVLSTLREFYSYVGGSKVALDTPPAGGKVFTVRPGMQDHPASSFVRGPGDARARAAAAATELFEKTSCIVCHSVNRVAGPGKAGTPGADLPQWQIAPLAPQHAWMPKATFNHAAHRQAPCADCHLAGKSDKASDVLMPTIKECRDCHAGTEPVVGKVKSDCAMCHGYHMPDLHTGAKSVKAMKP